LTQIVDPRPDIHLYYNPHINNILRKLGYSEEVIFSFNGNDDPCFKVWYPINNQIEKIEEVNTILREHNFELELITLGEDLGDLSLLPESISDFVGSSF